MFSQSKRNNKALKRRVALAIPAIALFHATGANAQARVTPEPVPELDERAMLLAVKKPSVGNSAVGNGSGQTVVSWKTGPNSYPFDYNVRCYAAEAGSKALTCDELRTQTPVSDIVTGNLPMVYSKIDAEVGGIPDKYVDCYITVSGPKGGKSKCTYAGRAEIPEPTTITCVGYPVGATFDVNGVTYTVVDDTTIREELSTAQFETSCTTKVTDMSLLFQNAATFTGDISTWDTSSVTTMSGMFDGASLFNTDISAWNTSNVVTMAGMFNAAPIFNADISGWDTAKVDAMESMFEGATSFNQNLENWTADPTTCTDFGAGATAWYAAYDTSGATAPVDSSPPLGASMATAGCTITATP